MTDLPASLSVKEVAVLAGVHEHTVRRHIDQGRLRASRLGGSSVLRIRPEDFEAWAYGDPVKPHERPAPPGRPAASSRGDRAPGSLARLREIDQGRVP